MVLQQVVPHARLDSAFRAVVDASGKPVANYGIGFMVQPHGSSVWFGHGGAVAGYSAAVAFDRARHVGVIILRNALGGQLNLQQLADHVMERVATER